MPTGCPGQSGVITSGTRGNCGPAITSWPGRLFPSPKHSQRPCPTPALGRFLEKIDKGDPDDCWLWHGGRNGRYGAFHPETDTTELAHRYSYETFVGPIPAGMNINHSCDVCLCVNPRHLWMGSQEANVRDCRSKNRQDRKLEADDVREMRRERSELHTPYKIIAARYGVTPGCVQHAVTKRTWGHVA